MASKLDAVPKADPKIAAALAKVNSLGGSSKMQAEAKSKLKAKQTQTANVNAARKILNSPLATEDQKKQAQNIINPPKQGLVQSALGSIGKTKVGKGVGTLVDAFDTTRAGVASAVSETTDLLTDAMNLPGHQYVDASWGDFVKQTKDNIGVGTAFREKAAAKAAGGGSNKVFGVKVFSNPELLKDAPTGGKAFKEFLADQDGGKKVDYTTGGKALGIGVGVVGDIGLDPLTYATMGGSKLAGLSAEGVASEAMKFGEHAIAQKAATKGKWALSAGELEKIGLAGEGGLHFRTPGTGLIGRTLGVTAEGRAARETGKAVVTAAIPGTAAAMKYTPVGLYQSLRATGRGGIADKQLAKLFGGKFADLRDVMAKGTPDEFAKAFSTIKADQVAVGWEKTFADGAMRQWVSHETAIKKLGLDPNDVYEALGDTTAATDATKRILSVDGGPAFLQDFRTWAQEILPSEVNQKAGRDIITNFREGWQPSLRPAETKQYLIETYGEKGGRLGPTPFAKSSFEQKANIVVGGEFLGEKLVDENAAKLIYGEALTARDQAHRILTQKMAALGEDRVMAMFETDITKAMPAAIRNMSHRVYSAQMENQLLERGVATSLVKTVADGVLVPSEMAITQAKRRLQDLRLEQRTAAAQLTDSETLLSKLTQRTNAVRSVAESRQARRSGTLAKLSTAAKAAASEDIKLFDEAVASAGRITALLPDMRDGTNALLRSIDDLEYLGTPEYQALTDGLKTARTELDKSYETMGRLARKREELGAKVAKAEAEIEGKVSNATKKLAERDALARQLDDVEQTLADLKGIHSNAVAAVDPQILDKIKVAEARIGDVKKGRELVEDLLAIQSIAESNPTFRMDDRLRIESMLRNNFWTDLSKRDPNVLMNDFRTIERDLTNSLSDMRRQAEGLAPAGEMVDHIAGQQTRLTGLAAQAQELGRPDLYEEYAKLAQAMPTVDGAALVNPSHPEGLWGIGDVGRVDATAQQGFRGGVDGLEGSLGLKLTQDVGDTGGVVVKVSNPKVYGDLDVLDMAYEHRQLAAYGTKAPNAVRMVRNDMLRDAWSAGELTAKDVPAQFAEQFKQVQRLTEAGASFDEAVSQSFADVLGVSSRNYDIMGIDDREWMVSQLADRLLGDGGSLTAELKAKVADGFKQRLAQTHDAVVLPDGAGKWQTVVLNPEVLQDTGGKTVRGATQMEVQYNALRREVYRQADLARAEMDAVGVDLDLAHANFQNIERSVIDSSTRRAELDRTLRTKAVGQLGEKLHFEHEMRAEVDRLGAAASSHRQTAAKLYGDVIKTADEFGKAQARDALEVEHLLAQQADIKAAALMVEADMLKRAKSITSAQGKLDRFEGKLAKRLEQNVQMSGDPSKRVVRDVLDDVTKQSVRMLSQDSYAPNYIVQAINDMTRVIGPSDGTAGVLKAFDKITNLWKAQAITRPGFHIRNYMGGMINNWIGSVEGTAYAGFTSRFRIYTKGLENGLLHDDALAAVAAKHGAGDALKIRQIVEGGMVTGGQGAETKILSSSHATNFNPFSQNFKLYAKNGEAMVKVENHLRGAMAWDRLTKGLSVDTALSDVARYHFDYDDLSKFERGVVRRAVPFYTWSRKNLPLQVEMLLENPKQITRFMNIKQEIELTSQEEDVYPDWFRDNLTIRLPMKAGGGNMYVFPDAPFAGIADSLAPSRMIEQANPFIKAPIELRAGTKFFGNIPFTDGYQPVPTVWEDLGVPEVMKMFGKAEKDANGNWVMRDKDMYLVESWIPFLSNARRLAPSEDRFEKRRTYTWASFMLGQTSRTNTAKDQSSELIRRSEQLKSFTKDLQTKGYLAS